MPLPCNYAEHLIVALGASATHMEVQRQRIGAHCPHDPLTHSQPQYTVYNDALLTRDPVPHVQAGLNNQQQKQQKQQDQEEQAGADGSSGGGSSSSKSTGTRGGDNGDDSAALMVAEATETAERFAEYVMGHVKQGREGQLQEEGAGEGEGKGKGKQRSKGDGEGEAEGGGESASMPFSAAVRGVHVCRRFANVIVLRWARRGSRPCRPPGHRGAGSASAGSLCGRRDT